jgi:triacylglycerol lipase
MAPSPSGGDDTSGREAVVLLHGLGRTSSSMRPLARVLSEAGFEVHNLDYASREYEMDELARQLHDQLQACCPRERGPLHFVTHSMGGILLRTYLQSYELPQLARVVMLSPPNRGSELVDEFGDQSVFRAAIGPAGSQLGTDPESQPSQLGPVDFELGVITGDGSVNPWFSWLIPGDDDGTVSVESARITGMKEFLVVPYSHSFIMRRDLVERQVIAFLRHGRFEPEGQDEDEGTR